MKRALLATTLLFGSIGVFAQDNPVVEKPGEPVSRDEMLVWKWANFAILAIGAGYLINKHLPAYFRNRSAAIQKDITDAQAQKADAERRSAEMDRRLKTLGTDIEKFRSESKLEMEQEAARIRQETAQQIEKQQRQAQQEIESAGNLATRELREYAAKLALDLAEQGIRTRLDEATEAGLVDDFTQDLKNQGSKN